MDGYSKILLCKTKQYCSCLESQFCCCCWFFCLSEYKGSFRRKLALSHEEYVSLHTLSCLKGPNHFIHYLHSVLEEGPQRIVIIKGLLTQGIPRRQDVKVSKREGKQEQDCKYKMMHQEED